MPKWTRNRDDRTDQEIKDATTTLARAARDLDNDPMITPLGRQTRDIIRQGIDMNLDALEKRRRS